MEFAELLHILDLQTFVAFDFETTGLDPSQDKIIEFAAVRFHEGEAEDTFSTLINPLVPIPAFITNLTGISDEMVADAPTEDRVAKKILDFLRDDPIVAHNLDFDVAFLKNLALLHQPQDSDLGNSLFDTLILSQAFLFFLPNHQLGTVAEFFGLSRTDEHRALADTRNVGTIFLKLVEEMCSYPLLVIQKILSAVKKFPVPNKDLYVGLANLLVRENPLDGGILPSKIDKKVASNVCTFRGSSTAVPQTADQVFGEGGLLSLMGSDASSSDLRFEVRPEQIRYSGFVSESFSEHSIALSEAGTGLGKSLAYLYPALKSALQNGAEPTVIACHTKHLQDQLFLQEVPKLAEALDVPFTATVMKGRQNYVCKTRLDWLISNAGDILSPYEVQTLIPIIVWLCWTKTGDFTECPGFLNRRSTRIMTLIRSDTGFCTRRTCRVHSGCFLGPLREMNHKANVIIVNHSLLLSELSNPGILPPFSRVIIDEAHNLVRAAYDHYQITVHHQGIRDALSMADPGSRTSRQLRAQIEIIGGNNPEVITGWSRVEQTVQRILSATEKFFESLSIDRKQYFDKRTSYVTKRRYTRFETEFKNQDLLLSELVRELRTGAEQLVTLSRSVSAVPNVSEEVASAIDRLSEVATDVLSAVVCLATEEREDWVYWEEGRFIDGRLSISLNGVPIDVGAQLVAELFVPLKSVVVTSATLRVGESFDYLKSRLGLGQFSDKPVSTGVFPSPFQYEDQCQYLQWAGDMSPRSSAFAGLVADVIQVLNEKWAKRILVLFTSRDMLDKCYQELQMKGAMAKLNLFAQRASSSRMSLLRGFKDSLDGVLLGTTSFWEGVDLPKNLLEILIVTKLPFDVPSDPLVEAYSQRIGARGGNPFLEYAVPEAAIRLRQGFGRLIRSSHDEGLFINMDNRVVRKKYGVFFQSAIPVRMQTFAAISEL